MGQSPFGNRPIAHIYTSEIAPAWKKKPELDPRDGKNSTEKLQKLRHLKPPPANTIVLRNGLAKGFRRGIYYQGNLSGTVQGLIVVVIVVVFTSLTRESRKV